MADIINTRDLFLEEAKGPLVLRDKVIRDRTLSNFDLAGELEKPLCIENCQFIDCDIDNATMALWGGVLLENVVFNNFRFSGEAIIRPNMCSLNNVKFIDHRRDVLLTVLPVDVPNWRQFQSAEWWRGDSDTITLDISEFEGVVSIYGLHADGIVLDRDRQIAFSVPEGFDRRDVSLQSIRWKLVLSRAIECIDFQLPPDGVTSLLDKRHRQYDAFMSDLCKLVELGVVKA